MVAIFLNPFAVAPDPLFHFETSLISYTHRGWYWEDIMSTSYFITPFDPMIYHDEASEPPPVDRILDIEDFIKHLTEKWPHTRIERTDKMVSWDIEQGIVDPFDGKEYSFHCLFQEEYQTLSSSWCNDFILWYRRYVPEAQPLYFFTSASWESLLLTRQTTMEDITYFLGHRK